jgi:hypothetical protein
MGFFRFLLSYHVKLAALLLGHALSAVIALWEHASGHALRGNVAWGTFVLFLYLAAYTFVHERDKRHTEELMIERKNLTGLKDKCISLQRDLNEERESLEGCPQLFLKYESTPVHRGFWLWNVGTHAVRAKLLQARSTKYVLDSIMVQHIPAGAKVALEMQCALQSDASRSMGLIPTYTFQDFIDDLHELLIPQAVSSTDSLEAANAAAIYLFSGEGFSFRLRVIYADTLGREYITTSAIICGPNGSIADVRPISIEKVHAAIADDKPDDNKLIS